MDKKEVFLKFCKMNGIMPIIMAEFYMKKPKLWMYHKELKRYILEEVGFENFFKCLSRSNDFEGLFRILTSRIFSREYKNSKEYKNLAKKWIYFIEKNVLIKDNSLKVGDEVLINNWNSTKKGNVTKILVNYDCIEISYPNKPHDGICTLVTPFSTIAEINNKKPDIRYYIKYKGKTYGTNS